MLVEDSEALMTRIVWTALGFAVCCVTGFAQSANLLRAEQLLDKKDAAGLRKLVQADPAITSAVNKGGFPILSLAVQTDCVECARILIDAGADPKSPGKDALGRTPLHFAAGWSTLEMVQLLVQHGAPVSAKTKKGDTPLSFGQDNFYKDNTNERKKIVAFLAKQK
jgi:ankyrin repeat protein